LAAPTLLEGTRSLHLESALQDLPLHSVAVEITCLGSELAALFARYPLVPGTVLMDQGTFVGVVSRRQLLECWIRPRGLEIFPDAPLQVLHSYTRHDTLTLAGQTPILVAAQQALRRSPELLGDPILVQLAPDTYYLLDAHTLNIAYWQLRGIETQVRYERTQVHMVQSDKMANLGRLVDGVAHEILDPVSFIWGNLSHFSGYAHGLLDLLDAYEALVPTPPPALVSLRDELEVEYLREDLPRIIASVQTGAERLSKLASSLQNFCHIDEVYVKPANLHDLLDSITLLLKSRLSQEIQVVRRYDRLPPIPCYGGQLNQVFMNVLGQAVERLLNQAISQQVDAGLLPQNQPPVVTPKPTITITTQLVSITQDNGADKRWVSICIGDNGPVLTLEEQQGIQASFSTRQRAAKETSLTVSYQIVTAKHGGQLDMRSPCTAASGAEMVGHGTEFEILLPL
jgi:signal transduction histidine kinase